MVIGPELDLTALHAISELIKALKEEDTQTCRGNKDREPIVFRMKGAFHRG